MTNLQNFHLNVVLYFIYNLCEQNENKFTFYTLYCYLTDETGISQIPKSRNLCKKYISLSVILKRRNHDKTQITVY